MSNTPNEGAYPNSGSAQNSDNAPSSSNYSMSQQDSYGTTPNYPPPPEYFGSSQNPQGQYGSTPPNYSPPGYSSGPQGLQGQYGTPPNYPPPPVYAGAPQGPSGYGANPGYDPNMQAGQGYGYNNPNMPPPASKPLPLGEAIRQLPGQYWRVVTKPGAATFAAEEGKAAWNIVWVQILVITAISVLSSFIFANFTLPAQLHGQNFSALFTGTLRGFLDFLPYSYILWTPLFLFIEVGIYHLLAKAFGGRGTFLPYMYSYLLFYIPLSIVSLLLSSITPPIVGYFIDSAVSIYTIVLQVFMTMAVHRISGGRATLAVLIMTIILIVLLVVLIIAIVVLVATAVQNGR